MINKPQGRKGDIMKKVIICAILFVVVLNLALLTTQQIEGEKNTCIRQQENTTRNLLWKVYSAEPCVNMRGYSFYRQKMSVWHLETSIRLKDKYNECIRKALNELWENVQIINITSNGHCFRPHLKMNETEYRNKENPPLHGSKTNIRPYRKAKKQDLVSLVFFCKNPRDYRKKGNYCKDGLTYYYKYLYKMISAKKKSDSIFFSVYPDSEINIKFYDSEKLTYIVELRTGKTTTFQNHLIRAKLISSWEMVRLREHTNKTGLTIEMRNPTIYGHNRKAIR